MALAKRISTLNDSLENVQKFFFRSKLGQMAFDPTTLNFAVGNPHEMPLQAYQESLARSSQAQSNDWFGYKMSESGSQKVVAESLRQRFGMPFEPADIAMTTGGFAAIALSLHAVVNPDDEVIFFTPYWFFYELLVRNVGGVPVPIHVKRTDFDLDLEAIAKAINPKTAAIIINTPHNPTGKIYPKATLQALADLLREKSKQYGRDIYLLSDEPYNRIVFDGNEFHSPSLYYENTLLLYSYGKTLLAPGQRIGYIAMPPTMPQREAFREAFMVSQMSLAWAFPNALLQHALPELEKLSIDIEHLQYKRDWMLRELQGMGYDVHCPEGTFYLLPRSPIADDWHFAEMLAEHNIATLPGAVVGWSGYFRISLTANDQMIENSLSGFAAARKSAIV